MESQSQPAGAPTLPPRFLADAMLGRLATWLRILGYDTEYFRGEDDALLHQAWRDGRMLLTRDTRLLRRGHLPPHLFIASDHVREQVRQVVETLGLDPGVPPARRCLRCNTVLEPSSKAAVEGLVPEFIWEHHDAFWTCVRCGRIYWPGTHRLRMDEVIQSLWARPAGAGGGPAGGPGSAG